MTVINAIKPRTFVVSYCCTDCKASNAFDIDAAIPHSYNEDRIIDELSMFKPFACEDCGNDCFTVSSFREIQK